MTSRVDATDKHEDLPSIAHVRLRNIEQLIAGYESKNAFCRAAGVNPSQLAQFCMDPNSKHFRTPGSLFCRRVEDSLGMPTNALDQIDGAFTEPAQGKKKEQTSTLSMDGLSVLQVATVDSLIKALRSGVISNVVCTELLNKWESLLEEDAGG